MQGTWHHDYFWPVCWALLLHLAVLLVLLRPVKMAEPPEAAVISSYLYTPPKIIEPVAAPLPALPAPTVSSSAAEIAAVLTSEAVAPVSSTAAKPDVSDNPQQQVDQAKPEQAQLAGTDDTAVSERLALSRPGLAERSLASLANQYQQPAPDYVGWRRQQQQIPTSRSERWQQPDATPEQSVLFTYHDGKQLVRVNGRCLIADPALSGFEQLIKLKGVPCRESDDAILFRQTMAKWLSR